MSNKQLPPLPQSAKDERSLNELSSSDEKNNSKNNYTQQVATSNHPHLKVVKEVVSGAVHNAAQTLKPSKESHPEAHHQDGKSGPE
jgi:hypothetical protein